MGIGLHSFLQLKSNGNRRGPDNHFLWLFFFFLTRHYMPLLGFCFPAFSQFGSYQIAAQKLLFAGLIRLDIKNDSAIRGEHIPA